MHDCFGSNYRTPTNLGLGLALIRSLSLRWAICDSWTIVSTRQSAVAPTAEAVVTHSHCFSCFESPVHPHLTYSETGAIVFICVSVLFALPLLAAVVVGRAIVRAVTRGSGIPRGCKAICLISSILINANFLKNDHSSFLIKNDRLKCFTDEFITVKFVSMFAILDTSHFHNFASRILAATALAMD